MTTGSLTPSLRETLETFDPSGEPRTTPEVAEHLDLGRRSTYSRLERLVEQERLATKKVGANARVWWRPADPTSGDGEGAAYGVGRHEAQFRSLVDATEEYAIFLLDDGGYIRTWNPGAERIKGYETEEIVGEHFSTFYTDDDRAADVPEENLAVAESEGSVEDEGWRVRSDGSQFWANVTITAIRDETGDLEGFAKVTRDMTERREYEQRLQEETEFVRSLLDTLPDMFYAFDADGDLVRWNDRVNEVSGYTDEELSGRGAEEFVPDHALDDLAEALERILEDRERVTVELPFRTADGEVLPYEFTGGPLTEGGELVGFTGVGRDVGERKARKRRLERQRDELRAELDEVFTRIDEAFFSVDDEWRLTYVSDAAADLVDDPVGDLLGVRVWDAFPELTAGRPRALAERAMATQEPFESEFHVPALESWVEMLGYPSETGLSVYVRDVTERKERERDLELYETIVETVEDGIYVLDDDYRFTEVNDAYVELTGYDREELLGAHSSLVIDDEVAAEAAELTGELSEGDEGSAVVEADVHHADGDTVRAESRFSTLPGNDDRGKVGVVRDVSERVERERKLERRVHQQEVVTELGHRALEDPDLDTLLAETTALVADTLDADYSEVLEFDLEADHLRLREGEGWEEGTVGEVTVPASDDASPAAHTTRTPDPLVVEDLAADSRVGSNDHLRRHDVCSSLAATIGHPADPWGVLGTHDAAGAAFSSTDAAFVQSVANVLASAVERHRHERELRHQREQLVALNNLNQVVHETTGAIVERSTREEIEATVCEHLAESDSYEFAWIGDVDLHGQTVDLRTEAGVEGYLDDARLTIDPDDEHSQGPTGQAFQTGEVQTVQHVQSDPDYEPWRDAAETYGFRSSASIPIAHEGTIYGTLNVYAERPEAFEGREREVVGHLGEIVGHAIAAAERKRALVADEVVELAFQIESISDALPIDRAEGPVELEEVVDVGDGEFLLFGRTTDAGSETVEAMVESIPHYEDVTVRPDDDGLAFELRVSEPPVLSAVASVGGAVEDAVIEDDTFRIRIHLSPSADVHTVIDALTETYPNAKLLKRRQITARDEEGSAVDDVLSPLTERQRSALVAAYHAGFFEWPRKANGEDLADSLGVSPPTFHQHLRKAEQHVFERLVSSRTTSG